MIPKIEVNEGFIKLKQAVKQGYVKVPLEDGAIVDLSLPTSELRRGRYQELNGRNICNTLTSTGGLYVIEVED